MYQLAVFTMGNDHFFLFCLLAIIQLHLVHAKTSKAIIESLTYYDTLNKEDIRHIVKRNVQEIYTRDIHFESHGKKFHLTLTPDDEMFSRLFNVISVDEHGSKQVSIDKNSHYKGHLKGDEHSSAVAHVDNGVITATIATGDDTFVIEPMWRHVDSDPTHDMIVYKVSDIQLNLTHNDEDSKNEEKQDDIFDFAKRGFSRTKRDATQNDICNMHASHKLIHNNRCNLTLIGDYSFFKEIGRYSVSTSTHYVINILSQVNKIYQDTCWPGVGSNIGFQVGNITIHTAYSKHGYNMQSNEGWSKDRLLRELCESGWQSSCLVHMFTHQEFGKGVLGVAKKGSVCLHQENCGFNTGIYLGQRLLTIQSVVVVAHELGHNLKADHDPPTCFSSPEDAFIMCGTAGTNIHPNNLKFSQTSMLTIANFLKEKRSVCFIHQTDRFCSNKVVEQGEDCDPGIEEDKCCTKYCKFKKKATCSDANHDCCLNCQIASNTTICRSKFQQECTGETKCNGATPYCPSPPKLHSREQCGISKGNCINGTCLSLCAQSKTVSCICPDTKDACNICCMRKHTQQCELLIVKDGGERVKKNNGIPCLLGSNQGLCVNGTCMKLQDDLDNLLYHFTVSKFARFMQANIVGTILVFSSMIWIPLSCIVHYLDKKHLKLNKELERWRLSSNRSLLRVDREAIKYKILHQKKQQEPLLKTQYHISM